MGKLKLLFKSGGVILIAAAVFSFLQFSFLPAQFTMLCGESHALPAFFTPYRTEDGFLFEKTENGNSLTPQKTGQFNMDFSILGLLRKSATIRVVEPKSVALGGELVGIKLYMEGVIIVAMSDIPGTGGRCPGKEAGLRPGDRIIKIGGVPISGTDALEKAVTESGGAPIPLTVSTGGNLREMSITPVYYGDGASFKIGLWVKESAGGVGTVTFCDTESGTFGALGHPIEDFETGAMFSPAIGNITEASVGYITKSEKGAPGEICGVFGKENLGSILKNTSLGIYGKYDSVPKGTEIPVGVSTQVKKGAATVYSQISGKVEGYTAEITELFSQKREGNKNMVLRITDERLLNLAGGIVQGMSGSPIVQNGKLVGAVTHVFVNDPARGYGVFIENMLSEAEK